jgi:hypothetical protein
MTTETNEKITRVLLTIICFTVYMSFFVAIIAEAFRSDPFS